MARSTHDVPSIAVLAFVNLSREPDNEYFADGLTEELLNVLAKSRGLKVTSRTSAFAFKDTNTDIPSIGPNALRRLSGFEAIYAQLGLESSAQPPG